VSEAFPKVLLSRIRYKPCHRHLHRPERNHPKLRVHLKIAAILGCGIVCLSTIAPSLHRIASARLFYEQGTDRHQLSKSQHNGLSGLRPEIPWSSSQADSRLQPFSIRRSLSDPRTISTASTAAHSRKEASQARHKPRYTITCRLPAHTMDVSRRPIDTGALCTPIRPRQPTWARV
jgi:hypothetical protein